MESVSGLEEIVVDYLRGICQCFISTSKTALLDSVSGLEEIVVDYQGGICRCFRGTSMNGARGICHGFRSATKN